MKLLIRELELSDQLLSSLNGMELFKNKTIFRNLPNQPQKEEKSQMLDATITMKLSEAVVPKHGRIIQNDIDAEVQLTHMVYLFNLVTG